MANMTELLLKQLLSKDALSGITNVTGASSDEVSKIIGAALPSLISGAGKQTEESGDDFVVALADHAKEDTSNMNSFFNGVDLKDGAKILGHLLGNVDKTAEEVAKKTGVTKAKSKGVLSAVAPLFMSLLGKQSNASSNKKPASVLTTVTSLLGIKGLDNILDQIFEDDSKKKQTAKKKTDTAKKKTDTKKKTSTTATKKKTSTTAKKETTKKTDTKKKTTTSKKETADKKKTSTSTAKKTDTKKKTSTTAKKETAKKTDTKKKTSTTADKKKTTASSTKKTDTKKKTSTTTAKKKTSTTTAKKKTSTTATKKKTSSKKSDEIDLSDVVSGLLGKIVK